MKPYPHHYRVDASADPEASVTLHSEGLPVIETAPPEEFDGPGGQWSPETLLVAAVADCFILTFRAIARASGLAWTRLSATASGTLDRVEGGARFTALHLDASLTVPADGDVGRARRLLEKAEKGCLITRSLSCPASLETQVAIES